jgi:hypothetical protein
LHHILYHVLAHLRPVRSASLTLLPGLASVILTLLPHRIPLVKTKSHDLLLLRIGQLKLFAILQNKPLSSSLCLYCTDQSGYQYQTYD